MCVCGFAIHWHESTMGVHVFTMSQRAGHDWATNRVISVLGLGLMFFPMHDEDVYKTGTYLFSTINVLTSWVWRMLGLMSTELCEETRRVWPSVNQREGPQRKPTLLTPFFVVKIPILLGECMFILWGERERECVCVCVHMRVWFWCVLVGKGLWQP